jgi:hypothetical protein
MSDNNNSLPSGKQMRFNIVSCFAEGIRRLADRFQVVSQCTDMLLIVLLMIRSPGLLICEIMDFRREKSFKFIYN